MASVKLESINKFFGKTHVVKDVNLEIKDGEFVVLLGPSGCGKSTTLRMIAGLDDITSGSLHIGNRVVNNVEAKDRNLAMVFQSYALYPHMSVYENISFSLRISGVKKDVIDEKVREVGKMLQLDELYNRKPSQLSGGQRQRVAMGRAMVRSPELFLFDEPLSNLDTKLRAQMRVELKDIHERIKTTTIYVTHDQIEAMTLADRIVIMRDGIIEQIGSPTEVFLRPANIFVAGFIGSPAMNFFDAKIEQADGKNVLVQGDIRIELPERFSKNVSANQVVVGGLRPTDLALDKKGEGKASFAGKVVATEIHGAEVLVRVESSNTRFDLQVPLVKKPNVGDAIECGFDLDSLHVFSKETEKSLSAD